MKGGGGVRILRRWGAALLWGQRMDYRQVLEDPVGERPTLHAVVQPFPQRQAAVPFLTCLSLDAHRARHGCSLDPHSTHFSYRRSAVTIVRPASG